MAKHDQFEMTFSVSGSVNQMIEVFTDETVDEFFEKIKKGEYLTSLESHGMVRRLPDLKVVGRIITNSVGSGTEYFDFEITEH